MTTDKGDDNTPVWSPDGSHIVFRSDRKGQYDLYRRTSGGASADELLFESSDAKTPTGFSPDGRLLLFDRFIFQGKRADIWAMPATGGAPFELVSTPFFEGHAAFSPDGRWFVYDSEEDGGQIFVQPFPPDGRRVRVSTTAGSMSPKWLADGKRIVYVTLERRFMAVDLTISGREVRPGPPRELFRHSTRRDTARLVRDFAVDALGRRFLVASPAEEGEGESPLHVVLNWPAALRQRQ